jgi:hypothetical protein
MKLALEYKFPLEAITIAESLITDRLLSHVNHHGADFKPSKTTLTKTAEKSAKICRQLDDQEGFELSKSAAEWAGRRNEALHEIAKSGQGVGPKIRADDFLKSAVNTAESGIELLA